MCVHVFEANKGLCWYSRCHCPLEMQEVYVVRTLWVLSEMLHWSYWRKDPTIGLFWSTERSHCNTKSTHEPVSRGTRHKYISVEVTEYFTSGAKLVGTSSWNHRDWNCSTRGSQDDWRCILLIWWGWLLEMKFLAVERIFERAHVHHANACMHAD